MKGKERCNVEGARCKEVQAAKCEKKGVQDTRFKVLGEAMVGEISVWRLRKKGEKVKRRKVKR